MSPFVSVLIPSRSRPEHLYAAINSLRVKASRPFELEFLVRLDSDQVQLYAKSPPASVRGRAFFGDRGNGYDDLHLMYNQLAASASGEWLLQFNDDMRMLTPDWDDELAKIETHPKVALVNPYDNFGRPSTIHPFVRRSAIEAMGHFSLNPFCDAWVGQVFGEAGASHDLPRVQIEHIRDQLNDDVVEGQRQSTGWSRFNSDEAKAQRAADVAVLRKLMEES